MIKKAVNTDDSIIKVMTETEYKLRNQCSVVLLYNFKEDLNCSQKSISDCIDEWIYKGNVNTNGIVKYFEAYYQ
jgi:hypothetical protein